MASNILMISRLVGFRLPPSTTTTSSSFSLRSRITANAVFSPSSILISSRRGGQCLSTCRSSSSIVSLRPLYTTTPSRLSLAVVSTAAKRRWTAAGLGSSCSCLSLSSQQPRQQCRSFAAQSQSTSDFTVPFILDDYMTRREKLKPYQVAATWNNLVKAVQKSSSHNGEERQSFWMDHQASLQMLVDQTIQLADKLDGRWTATVTHSLVKLLHLTNSNKSLGAELLPLWNALLRQSMLHIQSNALSERQISNLVWAYAKATAGGGDVKVDGRLLDAFAYRVLLSGIDGFNAQELSNMAWGFARMNHKAPSLF
jgi:hypothetical protein